MNIARFLSWTIAIVLCIVAGCSGSQSVDAALGSDAATPPVDSGGTDSGASANDAATIDAGLDAATSDVGTDAATSDVGTDAPAMPCPNELGAYSVMIAGAGCGNLAASAPQCIQSGASACSVVLVSQGTAGSALNGTVDLDMSGNFSNGAITEGTVNRTGCTGTWNAAASQLTVDCGGIGSSQSCIATLTRTGNSCP